MYCIKSNTLAITLKDILKIERVITDEQRAKILDLCTLFIRAAEYYPEGSQVTVKKRLEIEVNALLEIEPMALGPT